MDALRMFVYPNIRTMKSLRVLCVGAFATTFLYTMAVGVNHGFNFAPIFIGDVFAMNWAGQFNVDFSFHLLFSALWLAWRNKFSSQGIALGVFALVGGIHVLTGYLFIKSFQVQTIRELLTGKDEE